MTVPFETAPNLSAIAAVRHGFFGRRGGADSGQPALNMSEKFGATRTVAENYERALNALDISEARIARVTQTHSDAVIKIAASTDLDARPETDGLVTAQPDIALVILTADCTPILFADKSAGIVGACHAGWRGAVSGIIANTVSAMVDLGAEPMNIIAAIGPTISGTNYEVGPDFVSEVIAHDPKAAPFVFVPKGTPREHFDLPAYARAKLAEAGIVDIVRTGGCTLGDQARYFSHRGASAGQSEAGRQAAMIARV